MTKLRQVCVVAALAAAASGTAVADSSVTVGVLSDYIFRGVYVSDASAFASADLEADSGFYLGAWGADIQNGLEYDVYLGYVGGTENVSWNVGFTGYYATDEAFDTAQEINLGFSVGFLDFQYSLGDLDVEASLLDLNSSIEQTYSYVITTFAPEQGPYYLIGRGDYKNINRITGTGSKGIWLEIGKDFDLGDGLSIGVSALYSPDVRKDELDTTPRLIQLSGVNEFAEYAMVMHITKNIPVGN